LAIKI